MEKRERLAGRLGFLLLSAGCAIGLGNVWRFPYVTGKFGGGIFLAVYLLFLVGMALPVLIMEFSVGRASRLNMGHAFRKLEPAGTSWHRLGVLSLIGCYMLMMFYIPVAGWMLAYIWSSASGALSVPASEIPSVFSGLLASPGNMAFWAVLVSVLGFGVCAAGLQKGVERVVKYMMIGLFAIMIGLAFHSLTLEGGAEGVAFYLVPDLGRAMDAGLITLVNEAMNQAFFTLSIGIGSMCIFGSYLDRSNTLTSESLWIVVLDTVMALISGLIIFPACFAFGVNPDAGPGLIFITLPNIFNSMAGGRIWGTLFFVFMGMAAMTTVIAVLENIVAYFMDGFGWSRRKSACVNGLVLTCLTMPCILGFNVLSWIEPLGRGTCIMDLEDFIISNNLLPLGSLVYCLFCCHRFGWGWDGFVKEADSGAGLRFPKWLRFYLTWILPAVLAVIFVEGYVQKFF
ncbi:MAG: sodium-dependent transporter [Mailhella sp.]|nr:sodium-dependent transporter [Mailhella sp.]